MEGNSRRRVIGALSALRTSRLPSCSTSRRASFEPGRGSLRSWLYGIAVNLVRNHWRTEQHLLVLDARLVPEIDLSDGSEAADQRVAASLLAPRLAAALGQLTVLRPANPSAGTGAGSPWSVGFTVTWAYQGGVKTSAFTAAGKPVFGERSTHAAGRSETVAVIYPDRTWWRAAAAPGPVGRTPACPPGATPGLTIIPRWAAFIRYELRCGGYRTAGRQWVDGIDAVKLTGGQALAVLWVNPATYLPVRATFGFGQGRAQAYFRWLSPTRASLSQLSMRVRAGFQQIPLPS
jgi:hypothetical protein